MVLAKDDYGANLAAGVVAMLLFHLIINIGMTLGVMPVTGIPCPLSVTGEFTIDQHGWNRSPSQVYMRRRKIMFQ